MVALVVRSSPSCLLRFKQSQVVQQRTSRSLIFHFFFGPLHACPFCFNSCGGWRVPRVVAGLEDRVAGGVPADASEWNSLACKGDAWVQIYHVEQKRSAFISPPRFAFHIRSSQSFTCLINTGLVCLNIYVERESSM